MNSEIVSAALKWFNVKKNELENISVSKIEVLLPSESDDSFSFALETLISISSVLIYQEGYVSFYYHDKIKDSLNTENKFFTNCDELIDELNTFFLK